jgi:hypothetical protein
MTRAPRCFAKTRQETPCRCAVMRGRSRCHKHGGAKGSGGPKRESNGSYKHGAWTAESVELRHAASRLLKAARHS